MKRVFDIFISDLKSVFHNVWAAIIILGIMIIPALYAWFNINSNWDPYGATGNLKIAVANSDTGTSVEGMSLNVGDLIVAQLAQNDKLGWTFVDEDTALEGVRSGEYYAAVVIPEDFSSSVGSIADLVIEKPTLKFYLNEKKNAIANKITDTGINTVQEQVNEQIVETVSSVLSTVVQDAAGTIEDKEGETVEAITADLEDVISQLEEYIDLVTAVNDASAALQASLDMAGSLLPSIDAKIDAAKSASADAAALLEQSKSTADSLTSSITSVLNQGTSTASSLQSTLEEALAVIDENAPETMSQAAEKLTALKSAVQAAETQTDTILSTLSSLENSYPKLSALSSLIDKENERKDKLASLETKLSSIIDTLNSGTVPGEDALTELKDLCASIVDSANACQTVYNEQVLPELETVYGDVDGTLSALASSATGLNTDLSGTLANMKSVLSSSSTALEDTADLLSKAKKKISAFIDEIEAAAENEKLEKIEELLARDPELVAAFMKEPVAIEEETFYTIDNYGSGMAPFYTTLAIWVGALVNCAIIKTKVKPELAAGLSADQLYFGRYLFFGFVSICQALIICLGDLFLLGIQCLHPWLFCLMGVVTAIVYSLLMYTLTVSFGDVGKAIAVILMVIQVAGSGGTYPIDILPEFYRNLYPWFPFNYAINGMRECIAGIYENAYVQDVLLELAFLIPSLLIGLVLRKPIIKLKEYIEKRVESSGLIG